jgi:RNA ligase (TIGR02306 family)
LISELGLTGRLAGKAGNRVKAIRLRGELSQGIVCWPTALSADQLHAAHVNGTDLAATLSITKWVPEIPTSFAGQLEPAPDFLPWIDIENIKRYPEIFTAGEAVSATEKLHGTACCVTWSANSPLQVSSKGLSAKHTAIVDTPGNVYWRAVHAYGLSDVAAQLAASTGASQVGLYGEVYGPGIQDLHYGQATLGYACFDARVVTTEYPQGAWLERAELAATSVHLVPVLYEGPYDYETLATLAEGPESISGDSTHLREGLVIRALPERQGSQGRAIAKLVSAAYLTRKGGTEYE